MQQFGYKGSVPLTTNNGKTDPEPIITKPMDENLEANKEVSSAEQLIQLNGNNVAVRRINSEIAANNGRLIWRPESTKSPISALCRCLSFNLFAKQTGLCLTKLENFKPLGMEKKQEWL